MVAGSEGRLVSANMAPASKTESVMHVKAVARAMNGMETFDPLKVLRGTRDEVDVNREGTNKHTEGMRDAQAVRRERDGELQASRSTAYQTYCPLRNHLYFQHTIEIQVLHR